MPRTLDSAVATESKKTHITAVELIDLDLSGGFLRFNNSPYDLVYLSNTYLGNGSFSGAGAVSEFSSLRAQEIPVSLSGVSSSILASLLTSDYQGRPATLLLALLDSSHQIIGSPMIKFKGVIDSSVISLGNQGTVDLTLRNRLSDLLSPKVSRYSDEEQKKIDPTDKGLEFASSVESDQIGLL